MAAWNPPLHGRVAPGFEAVREAFAANFLQGADVGAALCIMRGEQVLADLWGGYRDLDHLQPWTHDTLVNVYSTTKGLAAAAVAWVVEQGGITYDTPVVAVWPELRAACEGLTLAQLLSHKAGLCGVSEPIDVQTLYDWDRMIDLLERQEPFWPPGQGVGYHAVTWGYLAGEVVRRVTGRTLGDVFRTEIARPVDADVWIGLPAEQSGRVAPMISAARARVQPDAEALAAVQRPALHPIALDNPLIRPFGDASSRPWQAAEIAASNGHASAAGVARIYAALANRGEVGGRRLLEPASIAALTREEVADTTDLVLGRVLRRGRGVILNTDGEYGPSAQAFGHAGAGGSVGFADPEHGISFAYVMNQMQTVLDGDSRAGRLVRALYSALPGVPATLSISQ